MLEKIIEILVGLVLAGYGYIFKSHKEAVNARLKKLEERPICKYPSMSERVSKIEAKQDKIDPVLLKIQESLAKIETDIEWIKKKN